jgi:acyl-CoA dehydrogenase
MDFELPEEMKLLRETVHRFVDKELMPLEKSLPDLMDIPPDIRAQLEAKVREMGFWAAAVPTEFGGGGIGALGNMVLREQVSRCLVSDTRDDRGFGGSPWPILYNCDPDQRKKYLDPIIQGAKRHFFAMTEPGAGNDANGLATTAVLDGDQWVINGSKIFISHVDLADFGIVLAKTDPSQRARGGLSAFIVDKGTPGFNVVRTLYTMGAAHAFELHFDNCRIPKENLLGEVGKGFDIAGKNLTKTRLKQAASSLGLAQRALEMCIDYAQQRETFGKKLIDRGAVQMMLVESAAELRACRLMAYATSYRRPGWGS